MAWLESARARTAEVLRQRKQRKKRLAMAATRFNSNKADWVKYAQELGLLPANPTPADVASFLRHNPAIDKEMLGLYLGEDPERKPFNALVRDAFVATFDFAGMTLDEAMRCYLESFRLPGEAQKIDRLMEAMAKRLHEQSPGPLADADAAFVLAFSVIMLNTDLHNTGVAEKMTKDQFIRNNRGINGGQDFPREYLEGIYDSIANNVRARARAGCHCRPCRGSQRRSCMRPRHCHRAQEIKLTPDPHAAARDASALPSHWEGILRRQQNVAGASFTPSAIGRRVSVRAGVHERDMFALICDASLAAISMAFEQTTSPLTMEKTLEGMANFAKARLLPPARTRSRAGAGR